MTLLSALGLACDLRARPWTYPGLAAPTSGLLLGRRFHAFTLGAGQPVGAGIIDAGAAVDDVLRAQGLAPADRRTLVVAVGSNGAPDVLRAKFERAGVSGVVPLVRATARGIGVGHSAHVSLPGFVAAAPFRSPEAVTPVIAALLDDDQVAVLDESERTYTRRSVAAAACPLRFAGSDEEPGDWWLYDSDRGVLAAAPGAVHPLVLRPQADLLTLLAGADPALADLLGGVDPLAVLPALAADEARREAIRHHLADRWARASGIGRSDH